jgi:P27 family predicted phage terminase small subunit
MARRGPPPQPTRLKLLKGNPGKRPLNGREPQPPCNTPSCPRWLGPEAKKAWRRTVSLLRAARILTQMDGDALTAYCQTYARWQAAEQFLAQHGEVYPVRDERGNVRCMAQFPQVSIARNLIQVLRSYQQEFGLTPSSRTRVHASPFTEADAAEDAEVFGLQPRPQRYGR